MTVATPTSAQKDDTDVFHRELGERLLFTRKTLGINEQEAAEAAGVTVKTYRKWETGARMRSGFPIERLCGEFEVSIEWMLTGEGSFLEDSKEKLLARLFHKGLLTDAGRPFIAGAMTRH